MESIFKGKDGKGGPLGAPGQVDRYKQAVGADQVPAIDENGNIIFETSNKSDVSQDLDKAA